MNGFEKHNIKHSSASAINMWCDAPHMWVAQYLFNKRGVFSPAAKAGVIVEDAVVNVIARGFTRDDAVNAAIAEYNKFTALGCSDADRKRGEGIAGMIDNALEALAPYGEPEFESDLTSGLKQKKIELTCNGDGWQLPIIGYIDFHFPAHGLVIDLKSTMRMPSEMSDSHHRQACIYQKAFGNQAVKFLYVTPKKSEVFDCGDVSGRLAEIKGVLNRQEKSLALGDAEVLRSVVPVNKGSFYNDDAITSELFGI
jgi:hypothetical protein